MDSLGIPTLAQGRYRLEEVLGQGGMATVYRARDTRLGVERAIKVLEPAFVKSGTIRARFETEARTMARLSHPNILQVVDVAEDQERVFIVMNLAAGGSMWDRVRELGPLPAGLACALLAAVSDAVELAHQHGVVHRDIKPQNLLLSADATPLLTDFGIAQVHDPAREQALTRTGTVMGTWAYMAPEQRSSARDADARTDVYALGASLYALVVGEVPPDLFAASMDHTLLAGLDPELAVLIARATRYHKEERFGSASALAQALRALADRLPPPSDAAHALLRQPLQLSGGEAPHPDSGSGRVGEPSSTVGGTVAGLLDEQPSSEVSLATVRDPPSLAKPEAGADNEGGAPRRGRRPVLVWVVLAVVMVGLLVIVLPPSRTEVADARIGEPAANPSAVQAARPAAPSPPPRTAAGRSVAAVSEAGTAEPGGVSPMGDAAPADVQRAGSGSAVSDAAPDGGAPAKGPDATDTNRGRQPAAAVPADPEPAADADPELHPARVELVGTVIDIAFVHSETRAEYTANEPIPTGNYEVLARFTGNTQRSVALRLDLEPGQRVVLRCDDVFDKCSVEN